jgi:hypothetical protein
MELLGVGVYPCWAKAAFAAAEMETQLLFGTVTEPGPPESATVVVRQPENVRLTARAAREKRRDRMA